MNSDLLKSKFDQLAQEVINEAETYSFNIKDLPDLNNYKTNIRTELKFIEMFKSLDDKLNNCLYWFEVESSIHCTNLQILLNESRDALRINFRTVPAKNKNLESNVLYVGIRRGGQRKRDLLSNISGRICIHLGYYDKGSTQGLQLIHWAKDVDCNINLKVVQFEALPNDYLNTIEKIIAFKLKPLCGHH